MTKAPFIAVVDDEDSIRKALGRLLCSAGLEVCTFATGAELLSSLVTRRPDCLVLDLHMPGMNGFEVQTRLTQTGAHIPVIIMTGHDTPESREQAMRGQPSAYFRKPVDGQALLDAIDFALSTSPAIKFALDQNAGLPPGSHALPSP